MSADLDTQSTCDLETRRAEWSLLARRPVGRVPIEQSRSVPEIEVRPFPNAGPRAYGFASMADGLPAGVETERSFTFRPLEGAMMAVGFDATNGVAEAASSRVVPDPNSGGKQPPLRRRQERRPVSATDSSPIHHSASSRIGGRYSTGEARVMASDGRDRIPGPLSSGVHRALERPPMLPARRHGMAGPTAAYEPRSPAQGALYQTESRPPAGWTRLRHTRASGPSGDSVGEYLLRTGRNECARRLPVEEENHHVGQPSPHASTCRFRPSPSRAPRAGTVPRVHARPAATTRLPRSSTGTGTSSQQSEKCQELPRWLLPDSVMKPSNSLIANSRGGDDDRRRPQVDRLRVLPAAGSDAGSRLGRSSGWRCTARRRRRAWR